MILTDGRYTITKGVILMPRPPRFSLWDIIGDIIEAAVEIILDLIN